MVISVYKKHYPPALNDEVWRLDRIAKDGALHKKLIKAEIVTVEDFLRLLVKDSQRLRSVWMCFIFKIINAFPFPSFTSYFSEYICFVPCFLVHNIDSWEWNVQQDVGEHSGTCKDVCLRWEAIYLLH